MPGRPGDAGSLEPVADRLVERLDQAAEDARVDEHPTGAAAVDDPHDAGDDRAGVPDDAPAGLDDRAWTVGAERGRQVGVDGPARSRRWAAAHRRGARGSPRRGRAATGGTPPRALRRKPVRRRRSGRPTPAGRVAASRRGTRRRQGRGPAGRPRRAAPPRRRRCSRTCATAASPTPCQSSRCERARRPGRGIHELGDLAGGVDDEEAHAERVAPRRGGRDVRPGWSDEVGCRRARRRARRAPRPGWRRRTGSRTGRAPAAAPGAGWP